MKMIRTTREVFNLAGILEDENWKLQIGESLQNGSVLPVTLTVTGQEYNNRKIMKVSEEITYGGLLMTGNGLSNLKWNLDYRLGGQLP
tara:strand:+ start:206 stop:469 length:264 start_codon:yes stop_codon:yes gene_type:complete